MMKTKRMLAIVLAMLMVISVIPTGTVQAAPAKLNEKDFSCTKNGKKGNFLKNAKNMTDAYDVCWKFTSKKEIKDNLKSFKTNRGIKLGDKVSKVKKEYGNTSKVKVSKNERFYKVIKYSQGLGLVDQSLWKSYLEYNYKKGSDKYKIRFYLDKKDKVSAVVYLKNLQKFYNYPNEQVKSGLTFQAPKGKKVTTKTLNGNKLYILPKGTKISFCKGAISKSKFEKLEVTIGRHNNYGEEVEGDISFDPVNYLCTGDYDHPGKQGKSYDFKSFLDRWSERAAEVNVWIDKNGNETLPSIEKLLCCKMMIRQYTKVNTGNPVVSTKVAPEVFYFILEGDTWATR